MSLLKIKFGMARGIYKEGFTLGRREQLEEMVIPAPAMQISPLSVGFLEHFWEVDLLTAEYVLVGS